MNYIIKYTSLFFAIMILFSSCAKNSIVPSERETTEITYHHTEESTEPITEEPATTDAEINEPITTVPETEAPSFPPEVAESVISKAVNESKSKNVFVYSLNGNDLLGYKSTTEIICPASITKLLTALYALSIAPPDHVITVDKNDISLIKKGSAVAGVKAGYEMTVEQLITAMLLPSGNDAAYALAGGITRYMTGDETFSGKEAIDFFMIQLNEYAAQIGCRSTVFTVPDGYAGSEHYTDIHDLIIIGSLALKCEYIYSHTSSYTETLKLQSGQTMVLKNTNPFLNPNGEYYTPHVTGLKTGSLSENYSIYLSAETDGERYLIGVFGSTTKNGRYDDASRILNAIEEYKKSGGSA